MEAAKFEDVQRAITEDRLRVSIMGIVEGKRPNPKAKWRKKSLELIQAKHHKTPYHRVTFVTSNHKRYRILVHRLVWYAHNGPIPKHLTINHKNGIKTDNRLENLELMTHGENISHAFKLRLNRSPQAKFSPDEIIQIKHRLKHERQSDIAKSMNVSFWIINKIKRGITYKHIK